MRQCPRCASEINKNDKVCPRCGLPVSKMEEAENELAEQLLAESKSKKLNRAQKIEKKRLAKQAKKEAKRKKKLAESVSSTDFSQFASNRKSNGDESINDLLKTKKKRKKSEEMQFDVDENGEFNIDTKDVEIIGEETAKILEERRQQTYSIKKARGDYKPPKVKWWEVYKLADRAFARRKIKKEVSKASKVKPDFIKKPKLFCLALFLGWTGLHNFYAKNKRRGFWSLICLLISITMLFCSNSIADIAVRTTVQNWLVGCPGFIVIIIWVTDVVNIMFNKFSYRIQKDKFISGMNIETRAKLGEKYIDLELLHKPWPVRFKVWCEKKKHNYQEWKHERRQALIEREKIKAEKRQEQEKIDREVAEFEQKELEEIETKKAQEKTKIEQKPVVEVETEEVGLEPEKKVYKQRTAKISIKTKNNKNNSKKK